MSHGGSLQLFSQTGLGTTFKVYFPVEINDTAEDESLIQIASTDSWTGIGTILLVEDEDMIRDIAKEMFQMLGFNVIEAVNGKVALDLYQKNTEAIVCVVTDMGMPVMDGYALLSELKRLNPNLPVIISSGFGDTVVTSKIAQEDISGLISKPYGFDQLRKVLKSVLGDIM
jgi:DNA-binding NtrC family response regulator